MAHSKTVILTVILSMFSLFDLASATDREFSLQSFGCQVDGNASSSYRTNVNVLLSDFVSQALVTSFYNTSIGDSTDMVFGYYMCRGDLEPQACRHCIEEGREFYDTTVTSCKSYPSGRYDSDTCIFRYANHSTYGVWEKSVSSFTHVGVNVSNYQQYNKTLSATLESLVSEAAFGSNDNMSVLGFATKEATVARDEKIYSLAQCTPDIAGVNCSMCLKDALSTLRRWFDGYEGAKILAEKCYLKYDNQPFYGPEAMELSKGDGLIRPTSCINIFSIMLFLVLYFAYLV